MITRMPTRLLIYIVIAVTLGFLSGCRNSLREDTGHHDPCYVEKHQENNLMNEGRDKNKEIRLGDKEDVDLSDRYGTYVCENVEDVKFYEWEGAEKLYIIIHALDDVELVVETKSGGRYIAYDSFWGHMSERHLFFGPPGDGLLFLYRVIDGDLHTTFSGLKAKMIFHRIGPPQREKYPKGMYIPKIHKD